MPSLFFNHIFQIQLRILDRFFIFVKGFEHIILNEIVACCCTFVVSFNFSLGTLASGMMRPCSKQGSNIPRTPSGWVTLLLNPKDTSEDWKPRINEKEQGALTTVQSKHITTLLGKQAVQVQTSPLKQFSSFLESRIIIDHMINLPDIPCLSFCTEIFLM